MSTKLKYPLYPIQGTGRRLPIHIQDKLQAELKKCYRKDISKNWINVQRLFHCSN